MNLWKIKKNCLILQMPNNPNLNFMLFIKKKRTKEQVFKKKNFIIKERLKILTTIILIALLIWLNLILAFALPFKFLNSN